MAVQNPRKEVPRMEVPPFTMSGVCTNSVTTLGCLDLMEPIKPLGFKRCKYEFKKKKGTATKGENVTVLIPLRNLK